MQVEKEKLPWWRWALDFALGGIRSGFGLFRRNGKAEAGTETTAQAAIAEPESEEARYSTESSPEPEVIDVESSTEKSTEPESSLEPENRVSEVDASREKPEEAENSPEQESSPEPEKIGSEVESITEIAAADDVIEHEIALILPVELPEDDAPDLAPTEEEIA